MAWRSGAMVAISLLLSGCADMPIGDGWNPFGSALRSSGLTRRDILPPMPADADGLTIRRVLDEPAAVTPLRPQAGDIWPKALAQPPSLLQFEDILHPADPQAPGMAIPAVR